MSVSQQLFVVTSADPPPLGHAYLVLPCTGSFLSRRAALPWLCSSPVFSPMWLVVLSEREKTADVPDTSTRPTSTRMITTWCLLEATLLTSHGLPVPTLK